MVWFQVDDGMWSHPKMLGLSPAAGWLWTRAGAYCAQHLTDGLVPAAALLILGASDAAVAELTSARLWIETHEGYRFHDWHTYQRTRQQVEADRAAARDRQAKARARKAQADAPTVTSGVSHGVTNGVTAPVTNGVSHTTRAEPNLAEPTLVPKDMVTADAPTADPSFVQFWDAYPRKVGKAAALKAWRQATKRESSSAIIAACRAMAADPNLPTDRRLIPHPTTWLNRDGWDDEPYSPAPEPAPSASRMFAELAARPTPVPPRFNPDDHRPDNPIPMPENVRQLIQGESA